MTMNPRCRHAFVLVSVVFTFTGVACKNPEVKDGRQRAHTVKADIATFDPNADDVIDLDAHGSERPDDYAVQVAFRGAFEPMDECVQAAKPRHNVAAGAVLHDGMMDISVKLAPKTGKALAVNATLPGKLASDKTLQSCIREAVATVAFPKYNGPPLVVEFSTEVDAGYMDE